jgi:hypothetical protein
MLPRNQDRAMGLQGQSSGRAGGIRTHTSLRTKDFKSSASAISPPPHAAILPPHRPRANPHSRPAAPPHAGDRLPALQADNDRHWRKGEHKDHQRHHRYRLPPAVQRRRVIEGLCAHPAE